MNIAEAKAFMEHFHISSDYGGGFDIECMWCSTGDYQWGSSLEDAVEPAIKHVSAHHPDKFQPVEPVTDAEVAEVFGLKGARK